MTTMETTRQQKIARQIQKDLGEIFLRDLSRLLDGAMVSVTAVRVSPDLGYAKVYLSIFPFEKKDVVMASVEKNNWLIRKSLGARIRNQLRVVPELAFFLDDSLEYIENIDQLLREE